VPSQLARVQALPKRPVARISKRRRSSSHQLAAGYLWPPNRRRPAHGAGTSDDEGRFRAPSGCNPAPEPAHPKSRAGFARIESAPSPARGPCSTIARITPVTSCTKERPVSRRRAEGVPPIPESPGTLRKEEDLIPPGRGPESRSSKPGFCFRSRVYQHKPPQPGACRAASENLLAAISGGRLPREIEPGNSGPRPAVPWPWPCPARPSLCLGPSSRSPRPSRERCRGHRGSAAPVDDVRPRSVEPPAPGGRDAGSPSWFPYEAARGNGADEAARRAATGRDKHVPAVWRS